MNRLAPVGCTDWFDETDVTSDALKTGRNRSVRVKQINKVCVEVTVVNSNVNTVGFKIEHVPEVRDARKTRKTAVL